VPLFGKGNRSSRDQAAAAPPPQAEVSSHEFSLKLSYSAKSSEGVRVKTGPGMAQRLHSMLVGYVQSETELVEPLPVELGQASPFIAQLPGSAQWLQYNHSRSPVTRHALVVLSSVDAIDPVFETLVCGLLSGETDTTGYPEYNAIVGGVASHFDEITGHSGGALQQRRRRYPRHRGGQLGTAAARLDRRLECRRGRRRGLPALRIQLRPRAGLLLPQVRHADAAKLSGPGVRCRPTTTFAPPAATASK